MPDLKIDLEKMLTTGQYLKKIAGDLADTPIVEVRLAVATGDATLADAVRGFTSDWTAKRVDMIHSLDALAKSASGIHEKFSGLDTQLASALTAKPSAPATSGPAHERELS